VELRRLSWGDRLAAIGGIVMLVALFLPWYSVDGKDLTAWEAMAFDDVILAVTAVLAIAAAFVVSLRALSSISVAITSMAIMPAAVCLVVTVYRLVSPAPSGDASLEVGAWLALAASVAIAVGAWNGANDEGPARRSRAAEQRGAEEALARSELLKLPADSGTSGAKPIEN
jgi:hypothetical protein